MREYSADHVVAEIKREISQSSLRKTAERCGISPSYLSDIVHGKRGVSDAVAKQFGFKREEIRRIVYRRA